MKKYIKILLIIFLLILFIYLFYNFILLKFVNKHNLEKNSINISENYKSSPFSISKILIYSSGYGENQNTTFSQNSWILNILQYSDIAIYINNSGDELSSENSIKKLSITDINVPSAKLGINNLYYLDSLNFGTPNIDANYKINDSLEFTVLNDSNEEETIQYNTPIFFTDCSNPITLKYVNKSIKEKYNLNSNQPVFFDGKLLKMANINLKDLETNISFKINITSNSNKSYTYNLSIPIKLETETDSIYNGSILTQNEYDNMKFIEN